jgi:hypothetical protein
MGADLYLHMLLRYEGNLCISSPSRVHTNALNFKYYL